jgi:Domain of unknown function (DUF1932)
MAEPIIGIVHPGEMGSSIAAAMISGGRIVGWASEGRSAQTGRRAPEAALLAAILATADRLGVSEELAMQWDAEKAGFAEETAHQVQRATKKAWRFAGEMDEIAETFQAAGLPAAFHEAAAEIYRRLCARDDAAYGRSDSFEPARMKTGIRSSGAASSRQAPPAASAPLQALRQVEPAGR